MNQIQKLAAMLVLGFPALAGSATVAWYGAHLPAFTRPTRMASTDPKTRFITPMAH